MLAVGTDAFFHLQGQFPGRRQDQHPGLARQAVEGAFAGLGLGQQLQDGQGEAGGLAGAGLGAGHQVAAGEDGGNGLLLNGGGFGVTLLGNGAQDFGLEAEIGKQHGCSWWVALGPCVRCGTNQSRRTTGMG